MKPLFLFIGRATIVSVLCVNARAAETPRAPIEGSRVRVWSTAQDSAPTTGAVIALQDTAITVERDGDSVPVTVLLPTIRQLDLSTGRHRRTGRGALIGALVGFAALGLAVAMNPGECEPTGGCAALVGVAFGATGGAAIGAVVGSQIKSEGWRKGAFPTPGTAGPSGGHFAVALRLSF